MSAPSLHRESTDSLISRIARPVACHCKEQIFFIFKVGLPNNNVAKEGQNSMTNTAALYQLHKTNFTCLAGEQTKKLNIKSIFGKLLKDVGIEVPQSIETKCSMQAKAGDDSMQHAITTCVTVSLQM